MDFTKFPISNTTLPWLNYGVNIFPNFVRTGSLFSKTTPFYLDGKQTTSTDPVNAIFLYENNFTNTPQNSQGKLPIQNHQTKTFGILTTKRNYPLSNPWKCLIPSTINSTNIYSPKIIPYQCTPFFCLVFNKGAQM